MEITVIVPTYNPQEYLWECLDCLSNQSLLKKEYEVIIILNGCKDPHYTKIKEYLEKNKLENFKLVYTEKKGVSNARNIGLDLAQGDYIAFIDDDDYVDKNYLSVMLETVKNEKGAICCANYRHFSEKTLEVIECTNYLWGDKTSKIEKYRKVFSSMGAKLIPISIIENIRFDIKLKNSEDALFMSLISKDIKKICVANEKTYYNRRVRASSANMRKKSLKEIMYVFVKLSTQHLKLLFDTNYSKKFILLRIMAIIKGTLYQLKK